ncbi:MAG: hypothetical protein ACD_2C00027G0019 [uncultured bacterium (gcode 4)]|uniref:HD domain-containing protein n=1 Tax=uncultured bacterium (gcode 4) TaxID=1234023 RepID=K2FGF0_9BACT|nr:MAG: hypothetical protein ACD_2C00027G0019 [uncultured bacterium (gcode 4)]
MESWYASSSIDEPSSGLDFWDFLQILETYKLKQVARNCSNFYHDSKENIYYSRKETTAEHVYSTLKLADFFLFSEKEFSGLDRLRVYSILLYHDDIEIETEDTCISDTEKRKTKSEEEIAKVPILAAKYPKIISKIFSESDDEYRTNLTSEANFAHAIDKMDALVHELQYPADWGPKWFTRDNVIKWFRPSFEHSPTFLRYFDAILRFLEENHYF